MESGGSSSYMKEDSSMEVNGTNSSIVAKKTVMVDGTNILGVLTYCIVFGVMLSQLGHRGSAVTQFFTGINIVTLKMIKLVMWFSPLGIMSLIMGQMMLSDIMETGQTISIYIATELAGLAVHSLVILPALHFVLTRQNPYTVYIKSLPALLTAFATCSSAATLPVTMQCVEERLHIDRRISRVILPVGATVNMDGAAIYAVIAPVFIAQYNGINLSLGDVITISSTAFLSSIGIASVPGVGFAMLMLVLQTVGLPDRGLALLVTIDWLLDRFSTTVNVASDCLVVGVVSRYTNLPPRDPSPAQPMLENDMV
ncbi:excitatory amino acid transporter-like [Haliotis rufescens]|uniref:excitatory amino acid transporter-like n=1 Tax=Haliotis rufescens TaxID=6454 RepID=UPI00201F954F|nr:excitatory amino acid transporter-like [Haliotis rufescens]